MHVLNEVCDEKVTGLNPCCSKLKKIECQKRVENLREIYPALALVGKEEFISKFLSYLDDSEYKIVIDLIKKNDELVNIEDKNALYLAFLCMLISSGHANLLSLVLRRNPHLLTHENGLTYEFAKEWLIFLRSARFFSGSMGKRQGPLEKHDISLLVMRMG